MEAPIQIKNTKTEKEKKKKIFEEASLKLGYLIDIDNTRILASLVFRLEQQGIWTVYFTFFAR